MTSNLGSGVDMIQVRCDSRDMDNIIQGNFVKQVALENATLVDGLISEWEDVLPASRLSAYSFAEQA